MKEYHGGKKYKDYLLKRYSISREGHLMKDTHGEVYRIRPKKEGKDYFFYDGVTGLKVDALKFAVLYHFDLWVMKKQLKLKNGDPNNLKPTNIIEKTLVTNHQLINYFPPSSIVIVISYFRNLMLKLNLVLLTIIILIKL